VVQNPNPFDSVDPRVIDSRPNLFVYQSIAALLPVIYEIEIKTDHKVSKCHKILMKKPTSLRKDFEMLDVHPNTLKLKNQGINLRVDFTE
jgi:hypothetical protein